jgi:hypothetical protein
MEEEGKIFFLISVANAWDIKADIKAFKKI